MVFVIKYRKHMLLDKIPLEFFKKLLLEIGERYWFKFDAIGIEEDHFHIVVGCAPRYSPSRVMQIIKSVSAVQILKDYPDIRTELWGGEFWSDGGHIDTVSEYGGLDKIKKYVEDQGGSVKQLRLSDFSSS